MITVKYVGDSGYGKHSVLKVQAEQEDLGAKPDQYGFITIQLFERENSGVMIEYDENTLTNKVNEVRLNYDMGRKLMQALQKIYF